MFIAGGPKTCGGGPAEIGLPGPIQRLRVARILSLSRITTVIVTVFAVLAIPAIVLLTVKRLPYFEASEEGGLVALQAADFPFGSASFVRVGSGQDFWLFHDTRGFVAFRATPQYGPCMHVPLKFFGTWNGKGWVAGSRGFFFDPCANSRFDIEGRVVLGPARRDLDRFEVELGGDNLFVDVSRITRGYCHQEEIGQTCDELDP